MGRGMILSCWQTLLGMAMVLLGWAWTYGVEHGPMGMGMAL